MGDLNQSKEVLFLLNTELFRVLQWNFHLWIFENSKNLITLNVPYSLTLNLYHKIHDQMWKATLRLGLASNLQFYLSQKIFPWQVNFKSIKLNYLFVKVITTINEYFSSEINSASKMQLNIVGNVEFKFITYILSSSSRRHQTRLITWIKLVQYQDLTLVNDYHATELRLE